MSVLRKSRGAGDPACLHCALNHAIESWAKENAPRNAQGHVVFDAAVIVARLAEVIGELVESADTGPKREQFERYARQCLEAAFENAQTGTPVMVEVGKAAREH